MKPTIKCLILLTTLFLISTATALPATGVPAGVTNNQANVSCTGVTGTNAWATYGYNPNGQIWKTENFTATAGTAAVRVWGAPLQTNTLFYVKCCDQTGCTATAQSFTTLPATVITQTTFSQGWTNLTQSHFNIMYIVPAIFTGYTSTLTPIVFNGLIFTFLFIGLWRANRSTRLASIIAIIIGAFITASNTGLELGLPAGVQTIGIVFMAAGLAAILVSFVHR
jgi:hypothetical protein